MMVIRYHLIGSFSHMEKSPQSLRGHNKEREKIIQRFFFRVKYWTSHGIALRKTRLALRRLSTPSRS